MREIRLQAEWGQPWPLFDVSWAHDRPDWEELLSPLLIERLTAWARFFTTHADLATRSFGSEERRCWFDLEGVELLNELEDNVGHLYRFRLNLWF